MTNKNEKKISFTLDLDQKFYFIHHCVLESF